MSPPVSLADTKSPLYVAVVGLRKVSDAGVMIRNHSYILRPIPLPAKTELFAAEINSAPLLHSNRFYTLRVVL